MQIRRSLDTPSLPCNGWFPCRSAGGGLKDEKPAAHPGIDYPFFPIQAMGTPQLYKWPRPS